MYLWVILSTFLAMMASYSLAPRADYREITVEPMAQADVTHIILRHRGASDIIKQLSPPANGETNKVTYTSNVPIDPVDIEQYTPHGERVNGDGYTSQIFCMTENQDGDITGSTDPCNEPNVSRMLITYGPIPERWLNMTADGDLPKADMINVIRNAANMGYRIGYTAFDADVNTSAPPTADNISNSQVYLGGGPQDKRIYVPTGVLNNLLYQAECNIDTGPTCLVMINYL